MLWSCKLRLLLRCCCSCCFCIVLWLCYVFFSLYFDYFLSLDEEYIYICFYFQWVASFFLFCSAAHLWFILCHLLWPPPVSVYSVPNEFVCKAPIYSVGDQPFTCSPFAPLILPGTENGMKKQRKKNIWRTYHVLYVWWVLCQYALSAGVHSLCLDLFLSARLCLESQLYIWPDVSFSVHNYKPIWKSMQR